MSAFTSTSEAAPGAVTVATSAADAFSVCGIATEVSGSHEAPAAIDVPATATGSVTASAAQYQRRRWRRGLTTPSSTVSPTGVLSSSSVMIRSFTRSSNMGTGGVRRGLVAQTAPAMSPMLEMRKQGQEENVRNVSEGPETDEISREGYFPGALQRRGNQDRPW